MNKMRKTISWILPVSLIFIGLEVKGQDLQTIYKCFGGYFTDVLCTGERKISIFSARYGVSDCDEFSCCPRDGDCMIDVASRDPGYYKTIQNLCNGRQACGNGLRADRVPPAPDCPAGGMTTHYVTLYYICLLDGEIPNITLPSTPSPTPTPSLSSLSPDPTYVGSTMPWWYEGGPLDHLRFNPLWMIGGIIFSCLMLFIPLAVGIRREKKRQKAAMENKPPSAPHMDLQTQRSVPNDYYTDDSFDEEEWDEFDEDQVYANGESPGRRMTRKSRKTRGGNYSVRSVQNGGDPIYDVIDPDYVTKDHTGAHGAGAPTWHAPLPPYPSPSMTPQVDIPKSGTWGGHRPNNLDLVDRKRKTLGVSGTGLSSPPSEERLMVTNEVYESGSPMASRARMPVPPEVPTMPPPDTISDDVYLDPVQTQPETPQPHEITNPAFYNDLQGSRVSGVRQYQALDPRTRMPKGYPEERGYPEEYRGRTDTNASDIYCDVDLGDGKVSYA